MDSIFHFSALFILLVSNLWFNFSYFQIVPVFILILLVRYIIKTFTSEYKYPEGPLGLPLIGSLPWVVLQGAEKFMMTMARKYGGIMTVRVGPITNVLVNDYDLLKEFSVDPQFQDRPNFGMIHNFFKGRGVIDSEGTVWKHQRRFMLQSLRDAGMGKMKMEEKINNELEKVIELMKRTQGQATTIDLLIEKATYNVIVGLAFNKAYAYDGSQLNNLLSALNASSKIATSKTRIISQLPLLSTLVGKDRNTFKKSNEMLEDLADNYIKEHKLTLDENDQRDILDLYLTEINKPQDDNDKTGYHSSFTEEMLKYLIIDLFIAGTLTTSSTIRWAILYMIRNPEIQRKVQQELDDVVGQERVTKNSDRMNLPFTLATLQEVERMASVVPFGLPRSNAKPATFKQYKFAARTMFSPHILAVHRDPKLWQDPERFMPTRFINGEGKVFRPPYLTPFGSGKRACAGEALAKMETFLFFATLMQKFSFKCEHGKIPSDEAVVGVGRFPLPYKVHINQRNT